MWVCESAHRYVHDCGCPQKPEALDHLEPRLCVSVNLLTRVQGSKFWPSRRPATTLTTGLSVQPQFLVCSHSCANLSMNISSSTPNEALNLRDVSPCPTRHTALGNHQTASVSLGLRTLEHIGDPQSWSPMLCMGLRRKSVLALPSSC